MYAYLYLETAKLGIDVVGESQLVGFPSQFPSVTMLDWNTGKPNARFEILRLLHDHMKSGATLAETKLLPKDVDALAFEDAAGRHLLVVNKRDRVMKVELPDEFEGGSESAVDLHSPDAKTIPVKERRVDLAAFAVTIFDAKH